MAKNDKDLDNNDESLPSDMDETQQPERKATTVKNKKDERTLMPHKDDDGDEYDPKEAWRGGDSQYPPSWTLYEKMSKENAGYQKGAPFHNCGKCTYYQAGHCKIVRGYIAQSMGCKYFSEKYTPVTFTMRMTRGK